MQFIVNYFFGFFDLLAQIIQFLDKVIWSGYVLIPLLLFAGFYFTFNFKFVQFRMIPEMFRSLGRKSIETDDDNNEISPMQAFFVGLASRVGTGNLAGVAIAISIGGPGAMFWMWIIALIGSASAFAESSLAQLYKIKDPETKYRGGPAYYMMNGLKSKGMAVAFAISISICFGMVFNATQANTIAASIVNTFPNASVSAMAIKVIVGIALVILTAIILFGGAQRIAKTTTAIVPFMASLYLIIAFVVVILRIDQIPAVLESIFSSAFTPSAALGGGFALAFSNGLKRGLFSNEAGMGSAPNAAATATTDHPANQGLIQSLGVFVDTLIVCSATGFIILSSGISLDPSATDGIKVTQDAMSSVVGDWATIFLTIAIFFFAFSSILGNYFYSQSNIEFLKNDRRYVQGFKVVVLIMVFWGSVAGSDIVWTLADVFMGIMAIINIIAILRLAPHAKIIYKDYVEQRKTTANPLFDSSKYPELSHITIWDRRK